MREAVIEIRNIVLASIYSTHIAGLVLYSLSSTSSFLGKCWLKIYVFEFLPLCCPPNIVHIMLSITNDTMRICQCCKTLQESRSSKCGYHKLPHTFHWIIFSPWLFWRGFQNDVKGLLFILDDPKIILEVLNPVSN